MILRERSCADGPARHARRPTQPDPACRVSLLPLAPRPPGGAAAVLPFRAGAHGAAPFVSYFARMRSRLVVFLALLQGAFYDVSSDVISPIYLLDAGAEILLASLWIVARARGSDPR